MEPAEIARPRCPSLPGNVDRTGYTVAMQNRPVHPVVVAAVVCAVSALALYLALGVPQEYAHVPVWMVRGLLAAGVLAGLYLQWTERRERKKAERQQLPDYHPYSR